MTDKSEKSKKIAMPSDYQRTETYAFCSIHQQRYPKGGQCPGCVAETKKKD